jgi:hypothetical protein
MDCEGKVAKWIENYRWTETVREVNEYFREALEREEEEIGVELREVYLLLAQTDNSDYLIKHLLKLASFFIAKGFLKQEEDNCFFSTPEKFSHIVLDLKVEILREKYESTLDLYESFTFGQQNCDIYMESPVSLSFTNFSGVVFINKSSGAKLEIFTYHLHPGLEFTFQSQTIRILEVNPLSIIYQRIDELEPPFKSDTDCCIYSEDEDQILLKKIGQLWAIDSKRISIYLHVSSSQTDQIFVPSGSLLKFNDIDFAVWYSLA